jgi:hypothetical protein
MINTTAMVGVTSFIVGFLAGYVLSCLEPVQKKKK